MKILKNTDFNVDCIAYLKAKTHRQPHYSSSGLRSSSPLQLIHSDLCGPFPPSEKDHDILYVVMGELVGAVKGYIFSVDLAIRLYNNDKVR